MRHHRTPRSAAILAAMATLAACGGSGPTGPPPLLDDLPRALSAGETLLIDAGNRFSFDLFRTATAELPADSNAFLSPLSASMALAMALNGARGETADAMRSTLGVAGVGMAEINQSYNSLIELLTGLDSRTIMVVANSFWSNAGYQFSPSFVSALEEWFGAETRSLDFGSPTAVETINAWVKEQTRDRIPTLLQSIRSDEVGFLINALYFKGAWRTAFDPDRTTRGEFRTAEGSTSTVDLMRLEPTELRFVANERYEAVDLLYGNGAFAMTVILPWPEHTPAEILAGLNPTSWSALTASFAETKVGLAMPKFRMEYGRKLNDDLTDLGMGIAFDGDRADFSGMTQSGLRELYITRVIQKTFVEVNEEGTEAAAATAVGIGVVSAPYTMTVNRPFLFLIRERHSNAIVFIGQINTL